MCLDVVLTRKEFLQRKSIIKHKKNPELKIGWKVVRLKNGEITSPHFSKNKTPLLIGKWLNEKDFRRNAFINANKIGGNNSYRIGFHILHSYDDAESYIRNVSLNFKTTRLVKVYYKKAVAYGKQFGCYTIIAKEMYIPRQTPFTASGNKSRKRLE